MPYSPTVWVEKVTAVGPTNMNHLETGVQATAVVADAALPVPAGTDGQFLKRVGGVWVPTSFATGDLAGLVARTTLAAGFQQTVGTLAAGPPGSPTTGDMWIATAVDSNGTSWAFQYDSTQTTYKWIFIGGPAVEVMVDTSETSVSGTYADLATVGPSFTLARGGDYIIEQGVQVNGSVSLRIGTSYSIGASAAQVADETSTVNAAAGGELHAYRSQRKLGIAAASAIVMKYKTNAATATFAYRFLKFTPIRII